MNSHVERAKVHPDGQDMQSTLFPLFDYSRQPVSPRALCTLIKLNWMSALRLFENDWLSFDPATIVELNPSQEAELRFLGGLVTGGCEESMMRHLLAGLDKPYAYRLDRLYYDWAAQCWQVTPNSHEMAAQFEAWVEQLADDGQMTMLERLRATVDRSIADLRLLRY